MELFVPSAVIETEYWWKAAFPLTTRALWYVCAYFFMFPLMLILNNGIKTIKKYQHIIIIFLLQLPTIFRLIMKTDNYVLGSGYSALWLICLYVIGAYFRLYGAPKWAKWYVTLPAFFIATYIAWSYRMNIETQYAEKLIEKDSELYTNRGILISYISPCMVVMAAALLMFFMQIKIKRKIPKIIISNLAKATFGVFVLHVGAAFWYHTEFWKKFNAYGKLPAFDMVVAVIGSSIAIYLVASAISLSRIYLFKLLHVHQGIDFLADLPSKIKERREQQKQNKKNNQKRIRQ
jgi:glucan phosphoethanolaminetransferase (alkaline phosphatase superfamily)